jgi:hypothetical protein
LQDIFTDSSGPKSVRDGLMEENKAKIRELVEVVYS